MQIALAMGNGDGTSHCRVAGPASKKTGVLLNCIIAAYLKNTISKELKAGLGRGSFVVQNFTFF